MNQTSTASPTAGKNLDPISLLEKLLTSQSNGYLQVLHESVTWSIYLENGEVTYASHSIDPFERLERHLRRLSHQITTLTSEVRTQVHLNFEAETRQHPTQNFDYQAICWLVKQQYLSPQEAATLVERLTKEVIELFLLVQGGSCRLYSKLNEFPTFCHFKFQSLTEICKKQLQDWQALGPKIWSPYQRPYLFNQSQNYQNLSAEQKKKLGSMMRGLSLRHIAAILDQDEFKVAQTLHPLILDGTVLLREPHPPFDQLPRFSNNSLQLVYRPEATPTNVKTDMTLAGIPTVPSQRKYKIACVDDSSTILNEIDRFLEDGDFSVFTINDSVKALIEINRIKPDLILLDVGMPTVDGYKLCRLIRNHSLFKTTPVVMVTGNTGLIDRARAKLVGATDYMTKPFTQAELLKMVFRYLI